MKVLWAHGFESTPNGSKPIWIKENLGWEVISINMSEKGWTIAEQTQVVIQKSLENNDLELIMGFFFMEVWLLQMHLINY